MQQQEAEELWSGVGRGRLPERSVSDGVSPVPVRHVGFPCDKPARPARRPPRPSRAPPSPLGLQRNPAVWALRRDGLLSARTTSPQRQCSRNSACLGGDWLVFWCVIFDQHFAIGREKVARWKLEGGGALWILEGFHLLQFLSLFLVDLFHNRDPPTTVLRRCLLSTTRRAAQQGFAVLHSNVTMASPEPAPAQAAQAEPEIAPVCLTLTPIDGSSLRSRQNNVSFDRADTDTDSHPRICRSSTTPIPFSMARGTSTVTQLKSPCPCV